MSKFSLNYDFELWYSGPVFRIRTEASFFLSCSDLFLPSHCSVEGYCWTWSHSVTHTYPFRRGIDTSQRPVPDNTQLLKEADIHVPRSDIGLRNFCNTKFHQKLLILRTNNRGYTPILINCTSLFSIMHVRFELSTDREVWEENTVIISGVANCK
jgi:hypothetical protein